MARQQTTPLLNTLTMTGSYISVSANKLTGCFRLTTPESNAGNVTVRVADDTGYSITLEPGYETITFENQFLDNLEVSGTAGDVVYVEGNSR